MSGSQRRVILPGETFSNVWRLGGCHSQRKGAAVPRGQHLLLSWGGARGCPHSEGLPGPQMAICSGWETPDWRHTGACKSITWEDFLKTPSRDFPGAPVVELCVSLLWARIQSLVRKLRSYQVHGTEKKTLNIWITPTLCPWQLSRLFPQLQSSSCPTLPLIKFTLPFLHWNNLAIVYFSSCLLFPLHPSELSLLATQQGKWVSLRSVLLRQCREIINMVFFSCTWES